jgi:hypothetical protein
MRKRLKGDIFFENFKMNVVTILFISEPVLSNESFSILNVFTNNIFEWDHDNNIF